MNQKLDNNFAFIDFRWLLLKYPFIPFITRVSKAMKDVWPIPILFGKSSEFLMNDGQKTSIMKKIKTLIDWNKVH